MIFSSVDYMVFLLLALMGFWALAQRIGLQNLFLFVMSCIFYMAWHPLYIFLILAPTVADFALGLLIHRSTSLWARRSWLIVSLVVNLSLLGVFKYYNFFVQATSDVLRTVFQLEMQPHFLNVLLPAGISFYTFETLSYTIDIYRRKIEPTKKFIDFALFITYFPKLVAGPILRAAELIPQLETKKRLRMQQASEGLFLIALGMIKKIAIADYLALNLVDRAFDQPDLYTSGEMVVALYGFTMQMYCDFSGYTDCARGSAKLMGIELTENFDRPYQATSPAEFWRRWHMTLSRWLRDYVYFPLGGSHCSPARAYFNLWLTIFLVGIWHGASWTFVLYALVQGTAMVLHRYVHRNWQWTNNPLPASVTRAIKIFAALQFVVFSRILFRANSLENAQDIVTRLGSATWSLAQIDARLWWVLGLTFAAHYTPVSWIQGINRFFCHLHGFVQGAVLAAVLVFLHFVASAEVVPYIYFQF